MTGKLSLAMTGIIAALTMSAAFAFPEGAPWGAADPDADEHCGSCHFGYDATLDSAAITLEGLPQVATPGQTYELEVRFEDGDAAIAGFQSLATAGKFGANRSDIEYLGAAIRSTTPSPAGDGFRWTLFWTAPDSRDVTVTLYIAVVAGNDDLSPFGDRAFFRSVETRL